MKWMRKCPLFLLLLVSGIGLTIVALAGRNRAYAGYETQGKPLVEAVFWGMKDGIYPWECLQDGADQAVRFAEREEAPGETDLPQVDQTEGSSDGIGTASGDGFQTSVSANDSSVTDVSANGSPTTDVSANDGGAAVSGTEGTSVNQAGLSETESKARSFVTVEETYFDDALFIGDSRTQGLLEYGGIADRATFYCRTSLTIYDIFQKPLAFLPDEESGRKLTVEEALTQKQFGKIYLMLGINEMGRGTVNSFLEEYVKVVARIRELQPEAIIFVQGIMRVAEKKNAEDEIFNNTNINIRNEGLRLIANGQDIFYLDVNEVVCDENGNLYEDWTFDQIHLKAKYYQVWVDYLLAHGIET